VDGEKGFGFGQWFGVSLRPGGDVGWLILVASRGLSSELEHGGRQLLGPNSWGLSGPRHKGME
jgi:hypothetical protein